MEIDITFWHCFFLVMYRGTFVCMVPSWLTSILTISLMTSKSYGIYSGYRDPIYQWLLGFLILLISRLWLARSKVNLGNHDNHNKETCSIMINAPSTRQLHHLCKLSKRNDIRVNVLIFIFDKTCRCWLGWVMDNHSPFNRIAAIWCCQRRLCFGTTWDYPSSASPGH